MSDYDKSILDQKHILDSIQPEPIEWVYMVVVDGVELLFSSTDELEAIDEYKNESNSDFLTENGLFIVEIDLCKVNRELFSHKDWKTAYKQSEIIETKTL